MTESKKDADTKTKEDEKLLENDDDDDKGNGMFICVIVVMVVLILAGAIDSLTTKYFHTACLSLAAWTMDNAPWSFILFELIIFLFVVFCIPYGPLSVLSGALFYQKYKKNGILIAFFCLFVVTFAAGCVSFHLARNYFKETVQKKVAKSPKLNFLRNLDKLIEAGQGLEMVVLIRVAPLPNGPTNYFLGTTAVTWKDFIVGSILVGMPECLMDVCVGAGANEVDFSNPKSVVIFVIAVAIFMIFICLIGSRAKKMLEELDEKEKAESDTAKIKA